MCNYVDRFARNGSTARKRTILGESVVAEDRARRQVFRQAESANLPQTSAPKTFLDERRNGFARDPFTAMLTHDAVP